ncbi:flagellar biosynthetic protein FliO [Paludibaculum fermentans]|uniref:FliO/MopB family protein n=1 Tax=Paludibaculum fermentans TaxID=1473598 RepID=A0A7S7NSE2_PALFE|nr:flagellar biosynthetic protein FliO [Paludibaculum fermentans]QOY88841.1 FliO/MopB family protein [Paludibaculum fermentans]
MDLSIRLFLGLLVIAALYLTLKLLRGRGAISMPDLSLGSSKRRRMEVLERLMISAQQGIAIVRIDDQQYLLSFSPGGSNLQPHTGQPREQR